MVVCGQSTKKIEVTEEHNDGIEPHQDPMAMMNLVVSLIIFFILKRPFSKGLAHIASIPYTTSVWRIFK